MSRSTISRVLDGVALVLALAGPPVIIFVAPSVELLARNTIYFGTAWSPAAPFFAAGGAWLLAGLLFWKLRNRYPGRLAWQVYLLSGVAWIGYLAALPLKGIGVPLLLAAATFVVAALTARSARISEAVTSGAAFLGAAMIINVAVEASPLLWPEKGERGHVPGDDAAVDRTLPDIYHLVLDEFQTDMFAAVLNDDTREALGGFTWFPNASTPWGRTEMALGAMFTGLPYDYRTDPVAYITDAFISPQSMLTQLHALGYEIIGYLHPPAYTRKARRAFQQAYFHKELGQMVPAADQQGLFASLWCFVNLPQSVARRLVPAQQFEQLETRTLLPNDAPYVSLQSFRRFLAAERESPVHGGRYFFIHLILPHFPDVLGSDCSYVRGRETDVYDQSACAASLVGELAEMLRRQGRFRDALILAHGDHGARYVPRGGRLERTAGNFFSDATSWARSRPLVLLKPAGAGAAGPLRTDDRPMDLLDLYPTVFDSLGRPAPVPLAGRSLLSPETAERQRYYHVYPKDVETIIAGPIKRYRIVGSELIADGEITVAR